MEQLSLDDVFAAANEQALAENADGGKPRALTVTEAMQVAKATLEGLHLRVLGEVSSFTGTKYPTKYFSLKDEGAVLPCVMWESVYKAAGVQLQNGLQVEVRGKFSAWPVKGQLQFLVHEVIPAGEGALRIELAQREARLRNEGLFDADRKKPLPPFPQKIAVVTSPAGAVLHDIIRTLRRRWPLAEILVYGVRVEGAEAVGQIIEGLRCADKGEGELILLARGGGSFEDLLVFSDEELVRAIAATDKPLITGIGHEPDNSLADLAADYRASTPTAAAEAISSPDISELAARITSNKHLLARALWRTLEMLRLRLARTIQRPLFTHPETLLLGAAQSVDALAARLRHAIPLRLQRDTTQLAHARQRLASLASRLTEVQRQAVTANAGKLDALSPLKVLSRGYAAVFDESSQMVIDSVDKVRPADLVRVRVADGSINCEVKEVNYGQK